MQVIPTFQYLGCRYPQVEYTRTMQEGPKVDRNPEILESIGRQHIFRVQKRLRGMIPGNGWREMGGKFTRIKDDDFVSEASDRINDILGEGMIKRKGNYYYPPKGFREWHTNEYDLHGFRMYMVHTVPSGCGYFRYQDREGKIHTRNDFDGCIRIFRVEGGRRRLWHAVGSEGDRYSLGYLLSDESAAFLIQSVKQMKATQRMNQPTTAAGGLEAEVVGPRPGEAKEEEEAVGGGGVGGGVSATLPEGKGAEADGTQLWAPCAPAAAAPIVEKQQSLDLNGLCLDALTLGGGQLHRPWRSVIPRASVRLQGGAILFASEGHVALFQGDAIVNATNTCNLQR
jgi:hypothetical protein